MRRVFDYLRVISLTLLFLSALPVGVRGEEAEVEVVNNHDIVKPRIDSVVVLTTEGVKSLFLKSDMVQAQSELERALELDPTYAPAHYSLSQLLSYKGEDSLATHHAKSAHLSDTTNYWYLENYGGTLLSAQNYDDALGVYEQLLEMDPRELNCYRILAILYQRNSRRTEAIALLDSAEMRVGRNPYLFDLKRQLLLAVGDTDRAIRETRELVDEAPYDIDYRVDLAELYHALGQDSLAYVEYLEALNIDSMSIQVLSSLGSFMSGRGEYEDYFVVLKRLMVSREISSKDKVQLIEEVMNNREVIRRRDRTSLAEVVAELVIAHPNDPDVVTLQSNYYIINNDLERAAQIIKNHLYDEDPPRRAYYRRVIDLELYMDRMDSVAAYLDEAIRRMPDDTFFRLERAQLRSMEGQYDEAIEEYKSAMEGASDSLRSTVWCLIGDLNLYVAQQIKADSIQDRKTLREFDRRLQLAYDAYDESLGYMAESVITLNNYAYTICEHGSSRRMDEALEMSKLATELATGNATYLDTYGWILYRLGRYEEAKGVMRQAISLDANQHSEIALHYGAILYVLGEMTMAEYYWDKAKQWGADADHMAENRAEAESRRTEYEANKKGESKGDL